MKRFFSPVRSQGGKADKRARRAQFVTCPACGKAVPDSAINVHLDSQDCLARAVRGVKEKDAAASPSAEQDTARRVRPPADGHDTQLSPPMAQAGATAAPASPGAPDALAQLMRSSALRSDLGAAVKHPELPGHYLVHDFVSEAEQRDILAALDASKAPAWHEHDFNGPAFRQAWGVQPDLKARVIRPARYPMPDFLRVCLDRFAEVLPSVLGRFKPSEANALDYHRWRGHRLDAHFDDRHLNGDVLATLSLAGTAVMTYCKAHDRQRVPGQESVRVELPPRTLAVQTGLVRYGYTHAIANADLLSDRRVSITFRETGPKAKRVEL